MEGRIIRRLSGGDHEMLLVTVDAEHQGPRRGQFHQHQASDFQPGHQA
jgi:hypothetical protein